MTHHRPAPGLVHRAWLKIGALVAASAVLAGCAAQDSPGPQPRPTGTSSTSVSDSSQDLRPVEGFEKYYEQAVDWTRCGDFSCADVLVPLDWNDPQSREISIAVKFYQTSADEPLGTVVINPGGPGGSGVELVEYAPRLFGEKLLKNYNVLGFDPRGVGQSEPIACYDAQEMDRYLSLSIDPKHPKALEISRKEARKFAVACQEHSGDVLAHVGTQNAARDMDVLRAVVGDEQLNYLGYSYGTQLGATYAGLFPDNVGRMVLDGAIDTKLSSFEQSKGQAIGFENAFKAFAENCVSGESCPLGASVDEVSQNVSELMTRLVRSPLPTDDNERMLTQSLAFYGLVQPLYSKYLWPNLRTALDDALNRNDGSRLLDLSDDYFGRDQNGNYTNNQTEAFTAISCLDSRSDDDPDVMAKEAEEIAQAAPIMGEFFGYGAVACSQWPFPADEQEFDLSAQGAAPIMVVGTTNDPATPYEWAQGLSDTLASGFLVTHVGEGHTAYGQGSQCVVETVDNFLVEGTIPKEDPECSF